MAEIIISSVNKHGTKELASGDLILSFHVDRTLVEEVLPLYLVNQDEPLKLSISDGKPVPKKSKSEEQKKREKLYQMIQMKCDELKYTEDKMRTLFKELTGKTSRKVMTEEELESVEKFLYSELNPEVSVM